MKTSIGITFAISLATTLPVWADVPMEPLEVTGAGAAISGGIYDPSLTPDDSGRLWMSYSAVKASERFGKAFNHVGTRVAQSADAGQSWTDAGAVNVAEAVQLPFPHSSLNALWEHEVSSLAFDPYAPAATRWKMLWHRYLRVYDGSAPDSRPLFEHGWISLKTAADPRGPWTGERKLLVGKLYNNNNDNTIGPPEMRLDRLYPGSEELGACQAFTEPSMLVRKNGIYVSLKCATGGTNGRVVVLRCDHDFRSCAHVGTPLKDTNAQRFGRYSGFSATELIDTGKRVLLMVTPTRQPAETYHGCLIFELESLEPAILKGGSAATPIEHVKGKPDAIGGACSYSAAARGSGLLYSEFVPDQAPHFRLFRSHRLFD
jgi:hypothetical protein